MWIVASTLDLRQIDQPSAVTDASRVMQRTAWHELAAEDEVCVWRREELERAGYPADAALLLALSPDVDLHRASDLLRAGCPPDTAVRILL